MYAYIFHTEGRETISIDNLRHDEGREILRASCKLTIFVTSDFHRMTQCEFINIRAILFDLDGTLMDTDDQSVEKVAKFLRQLGISSPLPVARKLVMAAETPVNGMISLLDRLGLDALILPLWKSKKQKGAFRIIPGIDQMLAALKPDYILAVVTTRGEEEAKMFLRDNHLEEYFDLVVTRTSTRRLKPHPEPILFAAQSLGLPVSSCLMVGDTTQDIRSAQRAGAKSVGVLCGFGTRDELQKAGSAAILTSTGELAGLLS